MFLILVCWSPVTWQVKVPDVSICGQYLHFLFLQILILRFVGRRVSMEGVVVLNVGSLVRSPSDDVEVIFGSGVPVLPCRKSRMLVCIRVFRGAV